MVLTPGNDETDRGVRATDNAERRKVLHMFIVRDSQ